MFTNVPSYLIVIRFSEGGGGGGGGASKVWPMLKDSDIYDI